MKEQGFTSSKMEAEGFTLIELLLVIGLLVLSVGITTDIVLTLVRSYSKTQISNEIEQNANFVFLKLGKELKNAQLVNSVTATTIQFTNKDNTVINYEVTGNKVLRDGVPLTNNDPIGGVDVSCNGNCFTQTGTNPTIIKLNIKFKQAGSPSIAFTGSIDLTDTIVVRGTY